MNERDRSTAHEQDTLTCLEAMLDAGAGMTRAAGGPYTGPTSPAYAEAVTLFAREHAAAQVHATLSIAAAVRDLTNELEHHRLVP